MNNIPKIKIGIVGVSRDCFPASLTINRRKALVEAYAKKYADELVNSLEATITSPSETKEHAITIVQTDGKLVSITLGAFDCGTY